MTNGTKTVQRQTGQNDKRDKHKKDRNEIVG